MITTRPPSVHSIATEYGDPIAAILRPPPGESDGDRKLRLQREAEAKRVSDSIDEKIRMDEKLFRKHKEDVKVCMHSSCLYMSEAKSRLLLRPAIVL